MPLRATNQVISERVTFNLQRSLKRFLDLQTNVSTQRRINRASDDPTGTVRDLGYRNELAGIDQLKRNIEQGKNWNQTYETIMGDMNNLMTTAREVATSMANGTYDTNARVASATEIKAIIEQVVQLANSKFENRSIMSGYQTKTQPIEQASNGFIYRGDFGQMEFEIETGQNTRINSNAADMLLKQINILGANADLNRGVSAATLLADLNNGQGVDLTPATFTIADENLGLTANVDITGATTVSGALALINTALATAGMTNITAIVAPEGNGIRFDTTQTGQISGQTNVVRFNQGRGADLSPGKIRITDSASLDVSIDLSGVTTVTDLINKFNTEVANAGIANVTMAINAAGDGFTIVDSNPTPLGLNISENGEFQTTGADLGILGSVGAQLVGTSLQTQVAFRVNEAGGTAAKDLGFSGLITSDFTGSDLNPILTASTPLAALMNGLGLSQDAILMTQGERQYSLQLNDPTLVTVQNLLDRINSSGLTVTASINPGRKGIQISNTDPTRSFLIEEGSATGRSAKSMGLFGAADLASSLIGLNNALLRDDQEGAGKILGNIEESVLHLLNERATVGARVIRLESTDRRLSDKKLSFTNLLSSVEDADLPDVISRLSSLESGYQAALIASSKIIQPSLVNFLRG